MVITVFSGNNRIEKSILAIHMAMLRARLHRNALLIDATRQKHAFLWNIRRGASAAKMRLPVLPLIDRSLYRELEQLSAHRRDVVIDADGMDDADTRTALVVAHVVVVPVWTWQRDEQAEATAAELLERARLFNPLSHALIVVVDGRNGSTHGAAERALAGRIRSAALATTAMQDSARLREAFLDGSTLFETEPADSEDVVRLETLGREIFGAVKQAPGMMREMKAAPAPLKDWRRWKWHRHRLHRGAR